MAAIDNSPPSGADQGATSRPFAAVSISDEMARLRLEPAADPAAPVKPSDDMAARLRCALLGQGLPPPYAGGLAKAAVAIAADAPDDQTALATVFDARLRFAPISALPENRSLMLLGPPGAGKTVTAAKIAAAAVLAGRPARLITTDTVRAGGVEQLASLARAMRIELSEAGDPAALARHCRQSAEGLTVIDTNGLNAYDGDMLIAFGPMIEAAGATPILVLPAGTDAIDAAESAIAFAELGARHLIATRLDVALRFGGMLTAAAAADLTLAGTGFSAKVADGLAALNPMSLARLMLREIGPVTGVEALANEASEAAEATEAAEVADTTGATGSTGSTATTEATEVTS